MQHFRTDFPPGIRALYVGVYTWVTVYRLHPRHSVRRGQYALQVGTLFTAISPEFDRVVQWLGAIWLANT